MSVEQHHPTAESESKPGLEIDLASAQSTAERHQSSEKHNAGSAHERVESARATINRAAETPAPDQGEAESNPTPPANLVTRLTPQINYQATLRSLQRQLSPAQATASRIIHKPIVEKTSAILERTVARPSVTNGALWTAVIVGGLFYLTARTYGYRLSGSEMLFALIVGAALGLIFEAIWRAARH
jgi:hypothetical protein